jgi:hemerythrin-like domain-containing protein
MHASKVQQMPVAPATLSTIARLSFEHRQIDRVLAAMAEVVVRVRGGSAARVEFFALVVDFIEQYADGRHHLKEEGALFEALLSCGFSHEGPIGCMVRQHQRGRELVRVIREWVQSDSDSKLVRLDGMLSAATQYIELLWHHIATEDNALFPAALMTLSEESKLALTAMSESLDPSPAEEFGAAADAVVRLAQRLSLESGPFLARLPVGAEL